jgi:hypothetical protein
MLTKDETCSLTIGFEQEIAIRSALGHTGYGTVHFYRAQSSAEHQRSLHWLMSKRLRHRLRSASAQQANELWLAPEL